MPRAKAGWQQREIVLLILALGLTMGVVCGSVTAAVVAAAPQLLTRDAAVWPHISSLAMPVLASMLLIGMDVASTGVLLARRDLGYVARSFAVTLAALAGFLQLASGSGLLAGGAAGAGGSGAAAARGAVSLEVVWGAIVFFFGARAVQSCGRLAWLSWRRGAAQQQQQRAGGLGAAGWQPGTLRGDGPAPQGAA